MENLASMTLSSTPARDRAAADSFAAFGLDDRLLRGVRAAGFSTPRRIQQQTIPAALSGRDVLGLAQTGTGKTAAFALPLLQRLADARGSKPAALVLAPTRELATQIDAEIRSLARFTGVRTVTVFGGASAHRQIQALRRGAQVVIGCPGRILDLMGRGELRLDAVGCVVLDEADHMFDMGFLPDVRRILGALPARRQNLLFSATMPREIRALADTLLCEPHVVELATPGPARTIEHGLVTVQEERKRELLDRLLGGAACSSAIVFTRTKHRAKRLADQLQKAGRNAVALQGNMSQGQRDRAMAGFRRGRFQVLVATDIAARGIDVQGVSHVINFDVPTTPDAYTHRIGRTGRAELRGEAVTFVTPADGLWLRATERKLGRPIRRLELQGFPPQTLRFERQPGGNGRGRGGRQRGHARAGGRPQGQGRGAHGRARARGGRSGARARGRGRDRQQG